MQQLQRMILFSFFFALFACSSLKKTQLWACVREETKNGVTNCLECQSGYYINYESRFGYNCLNCGKNCDKCDKNKCFTCKNGFATDPTNLKDCTDSRTLEILACSRECNRNAGGRCSAVYTDMTIHPKCVTQAIGECILNCNSS